MRLLFCQTVVVLTEQWIKWKNLLRKIVAYILLLKIGELPASFLSWSRWGARLPADTMVRCCGGLASESLHALLLPGLTPPIPEVLQRVSQQGGESTGVLLSLVLPPGSHSFYPAKQCQLLDSSLLLVIQLFLPHLDSFWKKVCLFAEIPTPALFQPQNNVRSLSLFWAITWK